MSQFPLYNQLLASSGTLKPQSPIDWKILAPIINNWKNDRTNSVHYDKIYLLIYLYGINSGQNPHKLPFEMKLTDDQLDVRVEVGKLPTALQNAIAEYVKLVTN